MPSRKWWLEHNRKKRLHHSGGSSGGSGGPVVAPSDPTAGVSLTAPVLAFASATDPDSDNTQDFDVDFFEDIEGHFVRLVGTEGSATVSGPPYDIDRSNEIDGTEAGNLTAAFTTGALPDGLVAFKVRIQDAADESGNAESDWSNTVSKTIAAGAGFTPTYHIYGF